MDNQCFIDGCDFVFDGDDPDWRERFEQHFRWIHLPTKDFGAKPVAVLFWLLVHGVIGEEEFRRLAGEVLASAGRGRRDVIPSDLIALSTVSMGAGAIGLAATVLLLAWNAGFVSLHRSTVTLLILAVSVALFLGSLVFDRAFRRLLRAAPTIGDVRFVPYPDTGNDDDDSGGVKDEQR